MANNMIEVYPHIEGLLQQLLCARYIAKGTKRVRATTWNYIRFTSLCTQFISQLIQSSKHIGSAGNYPNGFYA